MRVLLAKNSGFCFGVRRAVEMAEKLADPARTVYTYGHIIHNEAVVNELREKGVVAVDSLARLGKGDTLIIRAHGAPPAVYAACEERGLRVIDATCPFVKRIHGIVREASARGRRVLIAGKPEHPEVIGIRGCAGPDAVVLAGAEEAEALPFLLRATLVAQTTLAESDFDKLRLALASRCADLEVYDTICDTTRARQTEAVSIARRSAHVLVLGSRDSANTMRLVQLCEKSCKSTRIIESIDKLFLDNLQSNDIIGIVAGASTPDRMIREVLQVMSELEKTTIETIEAETSAEEIAVTEPTEPVKEAAIGIADVVEAVKDKVTETVEAVEEKAEDLVEAAEDKAGEIEADVAQKAEDLVEAAEDKAGEVEAKVAQKAEDLAEAAEDKAGEVEAKVAQKAEDLAEAADDKAGEVEAKVAQKAEDLAEAVEDKAGEIEAKVAQKAEDLAEAAEDKAGEIEAKVVQKAEDLAEAAEDKAEETEAKVVQKAEDLAEAAEDKAEETEAKVAEKVEAAKEYVAEKAEAVKDAAEQSEFAQAFEKTMTRIRNGQIVEGTVISIVDGEIFVNIGYKSDGVIPKGEFSGDPDAKPEELFKEGDKIDVEVIKVNDGEGNVLLSRKNVESKKIWDDLMNLEDLESRVFEAVGKEVVKGGVIADIGGIRAFVPASQVSTKYIENLAIYIGEPMKLKVLEVDKQRKRIVASQKQVLLAEAAAEKHAKWEALVVGSKIPGIVRRITDFGAFVDIGGIDGLVHVTDAAWGRVKHPSDVFSINQEIEVLVLNVDAEKERVSLGYKQLQPKPWTLADTKYPVGSIVEGKVVRIVPFGAFVALESTIDGLIHISQVSIRRIAKVEDELKVGDIVRCKVLEVNPEAKRISLSRKEALLEENPELAAQLEAERAERDRQYAERQEQRQQQRDQQQQQRASRESSRAAERGSSDFGDRRDRGDRRRRSEDGDYELPPVQESTTSLASLFQGLKVSDD